MKLMCKNLSNSKKGVVIEDLEAQFVLKSQTAIDRIKGLSKNDFLIWVIDGRGKSVSPQEMQVVQGL